MLSQSYAKDLNRATEAARALEHQKLAQQSIMDAIKEVMASGQRSPKARISGNPVTVGQGQHFFIQLRNRETSPSLQRRRRMPSAPREQCRLQEHPEKTEQVSMISLVGLKRQGMSLGLEPTKRPESVCRGLSSCLVRRVRPAV